MIGTQASRPDSVLLVDDDPELRAMLAEYLETEGFRVRQAANGAAGIEDARAHAPDLLVLDVMMPGMDGLQTLRELRRERETPVIMLTAKGDDVDRIVGLELGADDYLAKPFNPRELVARIRAVLRRRPAGDADDAGELRVGELRIRPGARRAELAGRALELTSSEFNLLLVLAESAGHSLSKEDLSERAMGRPLTRYDRSIDMHISKLRRKLESVQPGAEGLIHTVRGRGYQLLNDGPD